ncbi:hypothetical protein D3C81_976690 [compost metagenome]
MALNNVIATLRFIGDVLPPNVKSSCYPSFQRSPFFGLVPIISLVENSLNRSKITLSESAFKDIGPSFHLSKIEACDL